MIVRSLRISIVSLVIGAALFAAPAESKAIFHWFERCCNGGGLFAPAAAPTYANYGADPCGCQPQRVNYVPQTCYRTQYVNMPTTVYRPVTVADPCTGCPVTTMRPMIAYLPQARQVPYVSYRIVYTNPPAVAYSGPGVVGYAAPGYTAPAGCSGCASAAPTYTSVPYAQPAAGNAAQPYYPGAITGPSSSSPATGGSAPESTFKNGSGSTQESQRPIPDPEMDKESRRGPASAPQLIGPDDSRTTFRPVRRAVHVETQDERTYTPVSRVQPSAKPASGKATVWRPSNR